MCEIVGNVKNKMKLREIAIRVPFKIQSSNSYAIECLEHTHYTQHMIKIKFGNIVILNERNSMFQK